MELEEHYHTRLLAYVLDIFGLPFQVSPPPLVMRQFVKLIVFLPERLSFAVVGAAEMAGCVMFDELRRVGAELFADEPDVAARIERLYGDILTDEIGHVGYCAARCTAAERALMRGCTRRTPVCPPNRRDQPAHRSCQTARTPGPSVRSRGAHCGPVERDVPRRPPLTLVEPRPTHSADVSRSPSQYRWVLILMRRQSGHQNLSCFARLCFRQRHFRFDAC